MADIGEAKRRVRVIPITEPIPADDTEEEKRRVPQRSEPVKKPEPVNV